MAEHPIEGMMGVTMEKIRQLVDANTIIGEPITVDGATIIPISRVTFGFASGGSDVGAKTNKQMFGGVTVDSLMWSIFSMPMGARVSSIVGFTPWCSNKIGRASCRERV